MHSDHALKLYRQLRDIPQSDRLLVDLRNDLFEKAIRYARLRADWELGNTEIRKDLDHPRRIAHNALIDACNILSRAMVKTGLDTAWRQQLGEDRKTIGDFACFVHCYLGLDAR